ncbi:MAG: hypothetical protein ACYS99_06990 [Planctomycetota bacterium]
MSKIYSTWWIRAASCVVLLSAVAMAAPGDPRLLTFKDTPELDDVLIGPLTDGTGKGKKFTGPAVLTLADQTEVSLFGKLKYSAKKEKFAYTFRSAKKTFPKVKLKLRTQGDPEVIQKVILKLKNQDKSKVIVREKAGAVTVDLVARDPERSDQLTRQAVNSLLAGDDDFNAIIAKLDEAIVEYPESPTPHFFRALTSFLRFVEQTAMEPGGAFTDLYVRAGFTEVGGQGFWDFSLGRTDHMEGLVKDTVPGSTEIVAYSRDTALAEIDTLLAELEKVPTDFEYRIGNLDRAGHFLDGDPLDDTETVWIDYGDVRLVIAGVSVLKSFMDFVHAYDLDGVDPNDFDTEDDPDLDLLDVLEQTYPDVAKLVRPAMLASAKQHFMDAFDAYQAGATHILAETSEQRDNGLFAPYRSTFRGSTYFETPAERDQFITEEASFRTWMEGLIAQFDVNADYTILTLPDGTAVGPDDQVTANFFRLWEGLDLRDTYLKTIVDPFTGKKRLGVTSIDDLTTEMLTLDGLIAKLRGVAPGPGDLLVGDSYDVFDSKPGQYHLRVDSVPQDVDGKTVDGSLADWTLGTDSVQISITPQAAAKAPRPDLGSVYLSRDDTYLYVGITVDVSALQEYWCVFADETDVWQAVVEWNGVSLDVTGLVADGDGAIGTDTTEARIPLSNFTKGEWYVVLVGGYLDRLSREHHYYPIYVMVH